LPVPNADSGLTSKGGIYSQYPALVLNSRKKLINALCIIAPLFLYKGNPLPVIVVPFSKSIKSYFLANSQCAK